METLGRKAAQEQARMSRKRQRKNVRRGQREYNEAVAQGGIMIGKIAVAMDSFKGSISGKTANDIVEEALKKALPQAWIRKFHLADGGEGSLDALKDLLSDLKMINTPSQDPAGRGINSRFGYLESKRHALIEIASTNALTMIEPEKRNPLALSSRGVGLLIGRSLDLGAEKISVFLGGSATVDVGCGMLAALGARFYDDEGNLLAEGNGQTVCRAAKIDFSDLDRRLENASIRCYCDVASPLTGPSGAALAFGPQKGGTPEMLDKIEDGMMRIMKLYPPCDPALPGGGAAGGLGYALASVLCAEIRSGSRYFLDLQQFPSCLDDCDLLVTGEGRIDSQTAMGKGPGLAAAMAREKGVAVIGLCGACGEDLRLEESPFDAVFPIIDGPRTLTEAMSIPASSANLRRTVSAIAALLALGARK